MRPVRPDAKGGQSAVKIRPAIGPTPVAQCLIAMDGASGHARNAALYLTRSIYSCRVGKNDASNSRLLCECRDVNPDKNFPNQTSPKRGASVTSRSVR